MDEATMALLDDGLIAVEVVGAGETLTAGDYVLVATDLQGCTSETPFTVGEPDALEVKDGERVGGDEAVEREYLEHLHGGDERAAPLRDDVDAARNGRRARGERAR